MAKSLLIETATEQSGLALVEAGEVQLKREFPLGLSSSRALMPDLVDAFRELGWRSNELAYIGVGIGPGSYTGMRVGAMVVKTLAYVLECPLVAFSSLEAFRLQEEIPHAVLFDAKISGSYAQLFHEGLPEIVALDRLEEYLRGVEVVISPHIEKLLNRIPSDEVKAKGWKPAQLNFEWLAKKCEMRFKAGECYTAENLPLMYLR